MEVKKDIANLKKLVRKNDKIEEKEFNRICKWIGVEPESEAGDAIFDHIYNGSDWMIEYQ
jgi:hypothetical protein